MKKILYAFFIILILLVIGIIVAVNSSQVIDKIAQKYAPEHNITYEKISGNMFTGIQVDNLKFSDQVISHEIIFKWNPLTLIQKKISIDKIQIDNANIDVIKSLVASFDVDESDDNHSGSFNFDVEVEDIAITIDPFIEEGIAVKKTRITANDVLYYSDGMIDVDKLFLEIDSNLTQFIFKGSMQERELTIETLKINTLNSEMLEARIAHFTNPDTSEVSNENVSSPDKPMNPLIPNRVKVKHFSASLLPREYMSTDIKTFDIALDDLDLDLGKIVENQRNGLNIGNIELRLDSNITTINLKAVLEQENVKFEHLKLKYIDIVAVQNLFIHEGNESKAIESKEKSKETDANIWIPKHISINALEADFIPTVYAPLEVESLNIHGKKIEFDVDKFMVKKAYIELNGTTNLSNITFFGDLKENHLEGEVFLTVNRELFGFYDLPIRNGSIDTIRVDLNASKESIVANVSTKAKQILNSKKGEFNIDIDSLTSHVVFDLETNRLNADTKAMLSTPYAKDVSLSNTFTMDETIHYEGEVKAGSLSGLEEKMIKPLENLHIQYQGNKQKVQAKLKSKQIKGSFNSEDMKKGRLLLETLEALKLNEFVNLPSELNATKVNAKIDLPINFEHTGLLNGKVTFTSNVLNLDADVLYDKTLKIQAKTVLPKNSLLKKLNKEVKWSALTPMNVGITMEEENVVVDLSTKVIEGKAKYHLENHNVDGKIKLAGLVTTIGGNANSKMKINTKIISMKALEKSITSLYTLEDFPPLEGSATLTTSITDMKRVDITLVSPKLIYKADRKTKHIVNDFKATVSLEDSKLVLDSYSLTFNKQKFFSTKPSKVNIEDDVVMLESIWINDTLNVTGKYNMKTQQGVIMAKASSFPIEHEYADIDAIIELVTKLDKESTVIDGKITLLGGKIKYDVTQKTFASDSDIIIVQDIKKKPDSPFMKNLSANTHITTKEPLLLKQGAINMKLKPELGIHKVKNADLMVLGTVELLKGGSYIFEGKKFILDKSAVHFTGNPSKPLLEIKVKYRSLNHLITIHVSGTPDAPTINFSSSPSLTKEQILSVILFDSEVSGDAHSGDEMMKMMGGAMAKSVLSDFGVKLDHLVLGEGNSVEVGTKLTNKITIIYVNDEVSSVKLKYRHGKRTESVIQVSEESQSYDIIFKDDF